MTQSVQLAPFLQGLLAHSLMSSSHFGPRKPARHSQKNVPTPSEHEPPLWHGSGEEGRECEDVTVQPCCPVPRHPLATQRDGTEPTDQAEASPAPPGDWEQRWHMGHTCSLPARHSPPQCPSCHLPSGLGLTQLHQQVLEMPKSPSRARSTAWSSSWGSPVLGEQDPSPRRGREADGSGPG